MPPTHGVSGSVLLYVDSTHQFYKGLTTYFLTMLHGIQDFKILLFRKFDLRFYTKLFDVLSDDHPTGIETCRSFYCFNITTRRKMQCISLVNYSRLDIASARHEKHKSANKNSRRLGAVLTERNADLPLNICPNSHVC